MRRYKPTHKKQGLHDVTQFNTISKRIKNKPAFFYKIRSLDIDIRLSDKYIIAKKECFVNVLF